MSELSSRPSSRSAVCPERGANKTDWTTGVNTNLKKSWRSRSVFDYAIDSSFEKAANLTRGYQWGACETLCVTAKVELFCEGPPRARDPRRRPSRQSNLAPNVRRDRPQQRFQSEEHRDRLGLPSSRPPCGTASNPAQTHTHNHAVALAWLLSLNWRKRALEGSIAKPRHAAGQSLEAFAQCAQWPARSADHARSARGQICSGEG